MITLYHTSSSINASKGILLALVATNLTIASEVVLAVSLAVPRPQHQSPLALSYSHAVLRVVP